MKIKHDIRYLSKAARKGVSRPYMQPIMPAEVVIRLLTPK